jgi:hypothetical protein
VVFKKHNPQLIKPLTSATLVMLLSDTDLLSVTPASLEIYLWEGLKIPIKTIELCGTRFLRGPPTLV